MKDIWNVLEERTRTWEALGRQGLADAIWADYVSVRFGRTGNPRALEYLYPYLNHAQKQTRLKALGVAARVFEGRGQRAIDDLDYFTKNPDLFLRDRAVQVVGSTVTGSGPRVILQVLAPYLNHRNQFVRKRALVALGEACAGRANVRVLAEIQRMASTPLDDELRIAIGVAFAGRPTEEVYALVTEPNSEDTWREYEVAYAISTLVRGASDEWYERACGEVFEPRLHASGERWNWRSIFVQRDGVEALCNAAPGRGMEALRRMLHLRNKRCTLRAIMSSGQKCFAGARS
jgi:HEAT repeat protein